MNIVERLKEFKNDERAVVSIFIQTVLALFGFSLVYAITYDIMCVKIFNLLIGIAPDGTPEAYFNNLNAFRLLYIILPFIAYFGIIMWAFVSSQKRMYSQ